MKKSSLSPHELATLKIAHRNAKSRKQADRIKTIIFLSYGYSYEETALLLLLDDETVRRYERCYKEKGLEGLIEGHYFGRKRILTEEQGQSIAEYIDIHEVTSTKHIQDYIKEQYNLRYSWEGTRKLLHRLGFSYRKPEVRPAKLDPVKQEAYKKTYEDIKSRLVEENAAIYFGDAVHPTMNGKPAYGWMRRGKPKTMLTNACKQRVNIQGAVDIQNQDIITVSAESINSSSTIRLLTKIRDKNPKKSKLYVILDNAKSHHSKKVKAWLSWNKKIELVFLPAYSPNLNVIERLWKFMHGKVTNNKYYKKYSDFKSAITNFFRTLRIHWPGLSTLLTDSFQTYKPLLNG